MMMIYFVASTETQKHLMLEMLSGVEQEIKPYEAHDEQAAQDIIIGFGAEPADGKAAHILINESEQPVRLGVILDQLHDILLQQNNQIQRASLIVGLYQINPQQSSLIKNDIQLRLTEKELDILLYLGNEGVVKKQKLLDMIWGYVDGVETHTLETHIYRLRQKILKEFNDENFLMTHDDGYYLAT